MPRPVTLFTGQWADLPLEVVAQKASEWGFDGLELACWGDHFEVDKALEQDGYIQSRWDILNKYDLQCFAISTHLVGQCVCDDPIDERHQGILPKRIWGAGNPEGVRQRAAEEVKNTARAAKLFGVDVVNGFTGSKIWRTVAMFPPVPPQMIDDGYKDFADRWNPILDVFDEVGVKYALEVHPSEIAYDFWTTERTLDAVNRRPAFGINFDPSHLYWQMVDAGGVRLRVCRPHLPHARQGVDPQPQRPQQHPGVAPVLWRSSPRVGLRVAGPGRRAVRARLPCVERHRLSGALLDRVGRQSNEP